MESIPRIFDEQGSYKVAMPFLDSLKSHSLYFDRAYSYSHNSNKGDRGHLGRDAYPDGNTIIPFHIHWSSNDPPSAAGWLIRVTGRCSLSVTITTISGLQNVHTGWDSTAITVKRIFRASGEWLHTMGLHDEYVLRFMLGELNRQQGPFFAVHYNTSLIIRTTCRLLTGKCTKENRSDQMKSMSYYNRCLEEFSAMLPCNPGFAIRYFFVQTTDVPRYEVACLRWFQSFPDSHYAV